MDDWNSARKKSRIKEIFLYFQFPAKLLKKYVKTMEKIKIIMNVFLG